MTTVYLSLISVKKIVKKMSKCRFSTFHNEDDIVDTWVYHQSIGHAQKHINRWLNHENWWRIDENRALQSRVIVECLWPLFTSAWRARASLTHVACHKYWYCTAGSAISISNCTLPRYHCLLYGHMVQMHQWQLRTHSGHRIMPLIALMYDLQYEICDIINKIPKPSKRLIA